MWIERYEDVGGVASAFGLLLHVMTQVECDILQLSVLTIIMFYLFSLLLVYIWTIHDLLLSPYRLFD